MPKRDKKGFLLLRFVVYHTLQILYALAIIHFAYEIEYLQVTTFKVHHTILLLHYYETNLVRFIAVNGIELLFVASLFFNLLASSDQTFTQTLVIVTF